MPPAGIGTHNPSKRVAEDPLLRQRGHWNRRPDARYPELKIVSELILDSYEYLPVAYVRSITLFGLN
jgi:hypothetical protein